MDTTPQKVESFRSEGGDKGWWNDPAASDSFLSTAAIKHEAGKTDKNDELDIYLLESWILLGFSIVTGELIVDRETDGEYFWIGRRVRAMLSRRPRQILKALDPEASTFIPSSLMKIFDRSDTYQSIFNI